MPDTSPARHTYPTPSQLLMAAGGTLIVIAMLALASSSWESFSGPVRTLTALTPLCVLYGLGFATRSRQGPSAFSHWAVLIGSLIFPFVLSVTLSQSDAWVPGSLLVFGVALVSLIWYLIAEFFLGERRHAPLVALAGAAMLLAFGQTLGLAEYAYPLFGLLLAYFSLTLGWYLDHLGRKREAMAYAVSGAIAGLYGAIFLPMLYFAESAELARLTGYTAIAALLFLVAKLYGKEWLLTGSPQTFLVRRATEQGMVFSLTIPPLLAVLGTDKPGVLGGAIAMGAAAALLANMVRLPALRFLGSLVLAFAALRLTWMALFAASAAWPVTLLAIGLMLVAAAYATHRMPLRKWARSAILQDPEVPLFGIGVLPEGPKHGILKGYGTAGGWTPLARGILAFFLLIVGIFVLMSLFLNGM